MNKILIFGLITILMACKENVSPLAISGKIKSVEHRLNGTTRTLEEYKYDTEGKLILEKYTVYNDVPKDDPNYTFSIDRTFVYDDENLIEIREDGNSHFIEYTNSKISKINGISIVYVNGRPTPEDLYTCEYDENGNLIEILNSNQSPYYTAKGKYKYDSKKNIYVVYPEALSLYYAIFRTEPNTSSIFRFNPGPNNILSFEQSDDQGNISWSAVNTYVYGESDYPVEMSTIESYFSSSTGEMEVLYIEKYIYSYY